MALVLDSRRSLAYSHIDTYQYTNVNRVIDMTTPLTTSKTAIGQVVIIGAGPTGLAAASHLLERDIDTIVLEAGSSAGTTIREWSHVRLFSNWRSVVDSASVRGSSRHGGRCQIPIRTRVAAISSISI